MKFVAGHGLLITLRTAFNGNGGKAAANHEIWAMIPVRERSTHFWYVFYIFEMTTYPGYDQKVGAIGTLKVRRLLAPPPLLLLGQNSTDGAPIESVEPCGNFDRLKPITPKVSVRNF